MARYKKKTDRVLKIRQTTPREDKFRSQFERDGYQHILRELDKTKADVGYETERVPYHVTLHYIPDFTLYGSNGKIIHLELKGRFTGRDRAKLQQVRKCNKDMDIRILFQQDQRLSKTSKTYYTEWAEKHNFPFCVKRIPDEWFKELYESETKFLHENSSSNT